MVKPESDVPKTKVKGRRLFLFVRDDPTTPSITQIKVWGVTMLNLKSPVLQDSNSRVHGHGQGHLDGAKCLPKVFHTQEGIRREWLRDALRKNRKNFQTSFKIPTYPTLLTTYLSIFRNLVPRLPLLVHTMETGIPTIQTP